MVNDEAAPTWLWRLVVGGFVTVIAAAGALAVALALGAANPHPVGPLAGETHFEDGANTPGWTVSPSTAAEILFGPSGLSFQLQSSNATAIASRPVDSTVYTFAAAGAQVEGTPGALYGIVFDYRGEDRYSAVLINNNGFVTAYRQLPSGREDWYALQQWPHILLASESNELRVDVRAGEGVIRINEEVLLTAPVEGKGGVGVIASAQAGAQTVTFAWVRFWSAAP